MIFTILLVVILLPIVIAAISAILLALFLWFKGADFSFLERDEETFNAIVNPKINATD